MKHLAWMFTAAVMMVALVSGCSAKHKVDTKMVKEGFASATGELKTQADDAVKAITAGNSTGNYTELVTVLGAMTEKAQLSAGQKQAIIDTLVEVQVIVSEKPPADADALLQKIQDLQTKLM